MPAGPQVQRISRKNIDPAKWDAAVSTDPVPLPYGLHWWLDVVTDGRWDGLVLDDYRVVFPLPRLRRLRVLPAIIRPPYTQQLGPFGTLRPSDVTALLQAVPGSFQTVLTLRPDVVPEELPQRYVVRRRINYVIDLSSPFEQVLAGFPKTLRAYLRKTADDRLEPMDAAPFVALCTERLGDRKGIKVSQFSYLRGLIDATQQRGLGGCYQLREEGELLAAGFFPTWRGRTINIAPVSTARGLKRRGMSRLLALVMQQQGGTAGAVFDFEGSELPGVKEFFAKFGSVDEGYFQVTEKLFGLLR